MRKIAVFTGTRADYGLLYWILKELDESKDIQLQLYVGGTHLSHDFGYTINQIIEDGFQVLERIDYLTCDDSAIGITKSMAHALSCSADAINNNKPDLVIILGDRYEVFAVAQAAMIARIPIAHIHGGEITRGSIDDAVRHAITKIAQLHFAVTEKYRQRIIQMGEQPDRVFNYGAPSLDNLHRLTLLTARELSEMFKFDLNSNYFLVTFHPETLAKDSGEAALVNLLKTLDRFPKFNLIITYPNADAHGRRFIELIKQYKQSQPKRILLVKSLGQILYLSCLKHCAVVIGNSSSGLIEAPSFKVPTVNIGKRQEGRDCATSVLTCDGSIRSIELAIQQAISPQFSKTCLQAITPSGSGDVAKNIVNKLISIPLENLIQKHFFDLS